jgi:hypothetical protein
MAKRRTADRCVKLIGCDRASQVVYPHEVISKADNLRDHACSAQGVASKSIAREKADPRISTLVEVSRRYDVVAEYYRLSATVIEPSRQGQLAGGTWWPNEPRNLNNPWEDSA